MMYYLFLISLYTWALPLTICGWLVVLWGKPTGRYQWHRGVCFAECKRHPWPKMSGLSLGGVVLIKEESNIMDQTAGAAPYEWLFHVQLFLAHEYMHCVQAAYLGIFYAVVYGVEYLRTRLVYGKKRWHQEHFMENWARDASHEYVLMSKVARAQANKAKALEQ